MSIKITLTVQEINQVLAALAHMPYGQVHELIAKVRDQASPQVNAGQSESAGMTD